MGDVLDRLREHADGIFEGTPVVFAYLVGSVALGTGGPDSDVDIAVYVEPGAGVDTLDLRLRLPRRIRDATGIRAVDDVLVLNEARPRLLGAVLRQRQVIYSRDERRRIDFETVELGRSLDFEIHGRELDRAFLEATAEGRR